MTAPVPAADASVANRGAIAAVRVGVALLWIQNAGWKYPPHFGEKDNGALYRFTRFAVDHEVFPPWAWFVEHVVLPNFTFFGWATYLLEASLGAFLLVGLATRFWALVGVAHSLVITVTVLYAPHEWHWSYFLMILAHVALFATAAGRHFGVDGLWRPAWLRSRNPLARVLGRVS
jgi:thiosulfate dehydrogenase [quinone] large subunit